MCMYMCVEVVIHMHCTVMVDGPPCPFSSLSPVLGELQQADLITSEECKRLQVRYKWWRYDINDVIDVQRGKSPEVMSKTAEVLGRHGFEKESGLLAGRQSSNNPDPHPFACVMLYSGASL